VVYRFDEYKALELDQNFKSGQLTSEEILHDEKSGKDMTFNQTLTELQKMGTVPEAFPRHLNTCGRICVDPTGRWVLVSNRGHDSVCVYSINSPDESLVPGTLKLAGYFHTSGHTPRHFKFSTDGKWLFAANQDSDNLSVFRFNQDSGALTLAHRYPIPSPNFICNKVPLPVRRQEFQSWSKI